MKTTWWTVNRCAGKTLFTWKRTNIGCKNVIFSKGQVIQSWFDNQKYENGKIGKFP